MEVLRSRSFSTTNFSMVFLETVRFFVGGPMLEDEDDGSSRSLVHPDMATAQTKYCPYTRKKCLEIVRLPNVIASPAHRF